MSDTTQGTWKAEGLAVEGCGDIGIYVETPVFGNRKYLARVYGQGYATRDSKLIEERNATVALVLAAPGLQAECALLRVELEDLTGRCTCVWCGEEFHPGPTQEECRVAMKEHMVVCPKHPIHALQALCSELVEALKLTREAMYEEPQKLYPKQERAEERSKAVLAKCKEVLFHERS